MQLIKPITIGPVRIEAPVILAPMTGVTDMPFRKIVRRYGSGLNVTEMIASEAMIRETRQSLQKAAWDEVEEPVSMQLAGCSPTAMAEAAKLNEDRGAAIIDINMGCPVKKIVNGDAGSALMRQFAACSPDHRSDRQGGKSSRHTSRYGWAGMIAASMRLNLPGLRKILACESSRSTGARGARCIRDLRIGRLCAR